MTAIDRYTCGAGDGMFNDNRNGYWVTYKDHVKEIEQLQAKHEEELKQAVINAYINGCDIGSVETNRQWGEKYYEANHTKG